MVHRILIEYRHARTRSCYVISILITALVLEACGGGSGGSGGASALDSDGDGLTDALETTLGTNVNLADTDADGLADGAEVNTLSTDPLDTDSDGDKIWDGEEVNMFSTNPNATDTDSDGMSDRADPQPATLNAAIPATEYGVFTDNALGTARTRISDTRYEQNHVVYAPPNAPGTPFLIYQTYLADRNLDGKFDEGDLTATAIAIMNVDGSRPRLLTDLDGNGRRQDNGAVDATPEPSPDGQHIIFASNRHDTSGFQVRLYVMDIDGGNAVQLAYASNGPAADEIDGDPHWGPNNTIAFKREKLTGGAKFSHAYTATLDTTSMTLSNVTLRTDGTDAVLNLIGPGDYDPKISPDGTLLTSYRHLTDTPGIFGDWDIWVGRVTDPAQPGVSSITLLDTDPDTANLFPRWNLAGNKLAVWSIDANNAVDPIDIIVFDLSIVQAPFSVSVANRTNITVNGGWSESMPSWNTDPGLPESLVYSASR